MQRSTNLNMYLPGNGDEQDITQVSWNFDKLDGEVLTKSEQTLTTSQKTQIRTNLGLGGSATASVANNLTTTSSGSVLDARVGPLVAQSVYLTGDDDTWAEIYAKINPLPLGKPATLSVNSTAIPVLTGNAITAGSWSGTITRTGTGAFSLLLKSSNNAIVAGSISGATSSLSGTFTYRNYGDMPDFPYFGISEGSNNFTVANNSRIELVFITSANTRRGRAIVYVSSAGNPTVDSDLGSRLAITTASNKITVTATDGGSGMYCTVYAGSIEETT